SRSASNRTGVHTVRFPRHAVKVITQSKIEGEIRPNFPVVFEESAPLVLVIVLDPDYRRESRLGWFVDVERQARAGNRTRKVQQEILRCYDVRAQEARSRCDARHRYAGVGDGDNGELVPIRIIRAVPSA